MLCAAMLIRPLTEALRSSKSGNMQITWTAEL
jgi:hypothetical protein